jgi:MGT family glycosyltransferase
VARFLFVVPPLQGHVNPTVSVGIELAGRGHDVAWTGLPAELATWLPPGAELVSARPRQETSSDEELRTQSRGLRGAAAFKFLWERVLLPLAYSSLDGVEETVDAWKPDVLVSDQQALAGAAVARRRGLLWATSATTTAEMADSLAGMPLVMRWLDDHLRAFQRHAGVPDERCSADRLRTSEHLVLVYSTRELIGSPMVFPAHFAFVGPSISERPDSTPFPWEWLDPDRPCVLVSLGTVNTEAGERFLRVAAEALAGEPLQAVLVAPPGLLNVGEPATAGGSDLAPNLLVRPRVPQLALLPRLAAVVSHAGHNTVCETLAFGLPLVLAPIRDDQPIVADQVVRAGAGVRVHFGRVGPDHLRDAVRRALEDTDLRRSAAAIRRSFDAAGGAPAAANRLERLCNDAPV